VALDKLIEMGAPNGIWRSGDVEAAPEGTAYDILGLIGDGDGEPYKRGGSTYKSNAAAGTGGVAWVWDGYFPIPGQRTVFAAASSSKLYVLSGDDVTPINTNGGAPGTPTRPALVGGLLVLSAGLVYGGSRRTAAYTTGTVTVTNGSATATGVGTTWSTNADVGTIFLKTSGVQPYNPYVVRSIDSNTQITLDRPFAEVTAAGVNYSLAPTGSASAPAVQTPFTQIANRLVGLAIGPDVSKLAFSSIGDPNTFATTDYHTFPGSILGMAPLRDTLLVFTTTGMWAISNLAYDLIDAAGNPQQSRSIVDADMIVWGHEGIVGWRGRLIVPTLDGVWLVDGVSGPQRISDAVAALYLSYVRAGYKPGVAEVFDNHLLLPVLDASNVWVDTLVCRLVPARGGSPFAWSRLADSAAQVSGFAERSSKPPLLLGASQKTTSRVTDLTKFFAPAAAVKVDADGTAPKFQYVTRALVTGNMVPNYVRKIRARYVLIDAATDDPTMTCEASYDGGATWTTLNRADGSGTTAPESDGSSVYVWNVQKRCRSVMFRFTVTTAAASCSFKSVEMFIRHSGKY
jgi:hypothetical protein